MMILAATSSVVLAETPAGTAIKISQSATVTGTGGSRQLEAGQQIFAGDKIETGFLGEAQIEFLDKTRLVVGPSSTIVIDEFVTGPSGGQTAGRFAVNAALGVFRFISGQSAKNAYEIKIPTATIGIRGTAFDFAVKRTQRGFVMLYEGEVQLCGSAGSCRTITDLCQIAGARSDGEARLINESDFVLRRNEIESAFPYSQSQSSLDAAFRLDNAPTCAGGGAGGPASGVSGSEAPGKGTGPGHGNSGGGRGGGQGPD